MIAREILKAAIAEPVKLQWARLVAESKPAKRALDKLKISPYAAGVMLATTDTYAIEPAIAAGKSAKGVMRKARIYLANVVHAFFSDVSHGTRVQAAYDLSKVIPKLPPLKP